MLLKQKFLKIVDFELKQQAKKKKVFVQEGIQKKITAFTTVKEKVLVQMTSGEKKKL